MSNQEELLDMNSAISEGSEDEILELSDEARVAFALYLDVMKHGKVTKAGTKVPPLNTAKISRLAEVNAKQVSKSFDKLRNKGFISNDDNGELFIPDIIEFEDWLKSEGAAVE
jgi:Fic family protein